MQFTYEQKDQFFGQRQVQPTQKEGIGRLLNKYSRKAVDDEQDLQIQRKKLVYPANSLNYSQIYSDLRIDHKEKIKPAEPSHPVQDTRPLPKAPESYNYMPKSLPKIKRNSRIAHNRESTKYVLNNTVGDTTETSFARTKAFSISHYDIYKNDTKKLEISEVKSKDSSFPLHDFLISKKSEALSQSGVKEEENLKVDFESIGQDDLPQPNQQEIQPNPSNIVQKQPQITPQHSLEELTRDQIKLENHMDSKTRKNSTHHNETANKVEQKDEKEAEDKEEKEDQQEVLTQKNSKLSRHSSIRSKQKEVKLQQIKRELNKKMDEENKKTQSQSKKKQSIEHHDATIQGKTEGEIKLFERKIDKSVELPEIKHSIKSVHSAQKEEEMIQQLSKFKEEISRVKKEIHGVKEEMNEVKEQVHGFKEEVHGFKQGQKENARLTQVKQHSKEMLRHTEHKQPQPKELVRHESQIKPHHQVKHEREAKHQQQIKHEQENKHQSKSELKHEARPEIKHEVKAEPKHESENEEKIEDKIQIIVGEQSSRDYEHHKFMINNYIEVYEILKELQKDLKVPQINFHGLIKGVKKYLQVVAMGGLDHIEGYDMPLNRLKIIKNALLYERISIVIIAFAFAVGKVKDSLKYLINLTGYATNNTLLILKILEGGEPNNSQSKNPIMAKSDRLVLKRNFDTIRNNNDIVLDSIFKISKLEDAFYEPFKEILKSIGKNSIEQTFYNVLEYFSFFLCVSQLSKNLPFLAVAPNPYLRESIDKRPTLIIDIIEVFCHGTKKSKSHVFRPHTEHFLNEMSQYYELISFTCAYPNQIDKVIDILDQKRHIKHRLYRHHALMKNNILVKDPERIGRELSRLIILDSEVALMSEDSSNTIVVPSWKGNRNDTTLAQLCPILAAIALKKLDCRQATRKIHEQQLKNEHAGIKYLNFGINLQ